MLHFTFQSFQEAPSMPPLNLFTLVGRAELPPHHHLDKHTWWQPQSTTHLPRGAEPCQAQAIKKLLQSQRHWEHRLAGRNEPAQLFLMITTAALAQPPALAQSAWINSKPYRVSCGQTPHAHGLGASVSDHRESPKPFIPRKGGFCSPTSHSKALKGYKWATKNQQTTGK